MPDGINDAKSALPLGNLTADGSTNFVRIPWVGRSIIAIEGPLGGGTVEVEGAFSSAADSDANKVHDLGPNATVSVPSQVEYHVPKGGYVRITAAGTTTPVITADIRRADLDIH